MRTRAYFDLTNNELACSKLVSPGKYDIPRAAVTIGSSDRVSGVYRGTVSMFIEGYEDNALRIRPSSNSYSRIDAPSGLYIDSGGATDTISMTDLLLRLSAPSDHTNYIRLDSDGIRLSSNQKVHLGGPLFCSLTALGTASGAVYNLSLNSAGEFVTGAASSRRYKHDIEPVADSTLDPHRLYELPVRQYIFNADYLSPDDPRQGRTVIGLIAEEVAEHYPVAAIYDGEGRVENWQERHIVPALLALVQEQHHEIEALRERISRLEDAYGRQADK